MSKKRSGHAGLFARPVENRKKWYRMETNNSDVAEVFIYDSIGGWFGVEASEFVKELSQIDATQIVLRVNSPGGSVYDALAIMNALKRHKAKVTATVDGLAASAASFVVQAADEIIMGKGTELMIHDALVIAIGNAAELREEAEYLDRISNTIASIYADRAGGTTEEWRDRMLAETWYSAEEAVEAGLADSIAGGENDEKAAENLKNKLDFSAFAYAGRKAAPAPDHHEPPAERTDITPHLTAALAVVDERNKNLAAPESPAQPQKEGADVMSDKLIRGVAARLGLKQTNGVELSEETVLNALDEVLEEQGDAPRVASDSTPQAAAPGTVVLDEGQHAQLVADAAAGRAAREQQLADRRETTVAAAVNDGRIPPARREHWLNLLKQDPGAEDTLKNLAPGLIPLDAKGFTGGVNEATDEDASIYTKYWGEEK